MDQGSTIILASALIIIMLGMGLSLVLDDFIQIFVKPKAILVGLLNQLVLLPIMGFIIAVSFSLQPEVAIGIMILSACPGGPTSNLICHLAKGDTALSVSLTALSSIITIITIPFIVNASLVYFLKESQLVQLDIGKSIAQIFIIILIPISIGMLIRRFYKGFAEKLAVPVRKASGVVMVLVIFGIIFKERNNMIAYFQQAGLAALALNVGSMLFGFYTSKLFKLSNRSATSVSIESGIQNGTLAISIAVVLLNNASFAIAPAVYGTLMFFTGGVAVYYGQKTNKAPLHG